MRRFARQDPKRLNGCYVRYVTAFGLVRISDDIVIEAAVKMLDTESIICGLRTNASLSIDLGVEDYIHGLSDPRRYVTALRNLFAGLLLFYKSHLAFLSKDQECCIVRDNMDWEVADDGRIKLKGLNPDCKTVDVKGILDALKKFKICVDRGVLDRVGKYRNQTEHYFDPNGLRDEVVRAHVVDLLKLVRDFTTHVMRIEPGQLFSDQARDVLIRDEHVVEKERAERREALEKLEWYEPFVKDVFFNITCPKCNSELLLPEMQSGTAFNSRFVCRTCGAGDTYESLMSYYTDDIFAGEYEAHICTVGKETFVLNGGALWECPECATIAFDTTHGICLVCGHKGQCVRCGAQIAGEDMPAYGASRLCNYCNHMCFKED